MACKTVSYSTNSNFSPQISEVYPIRSPVLPSPSRSQGCIPGGTAARPAAGWVDPSQAAWLKRSVNNGDVRRFPESWGYPQSWSSYRTMGFSITIHGSLGVPPWPWKPPVMKQQWGYAIVVNGVGWGSLDLSKVLAHPPARLLLSSLWAPMGPDLTASASRPSGAISPQKFMASSTAVWACRDPNTCLKRMSDRMSGFMSCRMPDGICFR